MVDEMKSRIIRPWEEFKKLPFPSGFHNREPEGECMVTMDAALAGCISSAMHGQLDDKRHEILHSRIARLREILPLIRDDENASNYFIRLHQAATLAAEIDDARRA
ncbi:hypothetical protein [Streptomyces sp. NPDC048142]|uniref:hypothetical protein n=1 Tax=Streptomyces sp. NPDC048142 TaxID=3365501 RepID=UPI003716B8EC